MPKKSNLNHNSKNNGERINQWIETGDQMFTFIVNARKKFKNGTLEVKRGILSTPGSNLVIKDKRISVDIEKSILPLRRISKNVNEIKKALEPLNTQEKQAQLEQSCAENLVVLGHLDEARNLQRIQIAATCIYQYFKSQTGRPPNDREQ